MAVSRLASQLQPSSAVAFSGCHCARSPHFPLQQLAVAFASSVPPPAPPASPLLPAPGQEGKKQPRKFLQAPAASTNPRTGGREKEKRARRQAGRRPPPGTSSTERGN